MIIEINKESRLIDIQKSFSNNFPFLRLQFYRQIGNHKQQSEKYITDVHTQISDICLLHRNCFLEVHYWQKTHTVEKLFRDRCGLHVHIFRQHGEHWIQTSGTEELTLEEQNNKGRKATQEELHGTQRPVEIEKLL